MRPVSIDQVSENDILARPIYDIEGRRLLNSGVSLRPSIVQKLHEKGISSVYIDDEISEDIEVEGILCEETRTRARLIVKEEMQRLSQKKEINYSNINGIVDSILDEILSKKIDIINVKDIRMQSEKIFAHSVNVCVMAISLASRLSLPISKVKSIAVGALMHDLGKAFLSPEILSKKGDLSESERTELKTHPVVGYNMIKDDSDASATTKISILMHHEHIDGTGYPMGLSGDNIHYSARILSICNEFDVMINDEENRNFLNTTDAVEYLIGASYHIFDKSMVDEFIKIIPIYPTGSIVLLSNGYLAIIVKNSSVSLTRPVIRFLYDPKTRTRFPADKIVDLTKELSIKIIREVKTNIRDLMR